jgi:hypothetical protein
MENYQKIIIGIIALIIFRFTIGNYLRRKIKERNKKKE